MNSALHFSLLLLTIETVAIDYQQLSLLANAIDYQDYCY